MNTKSEIVDMAGYDDQLLTPEELAQWLNVKISTIYKWVAMRYIPFLKLGGKVKGSVRFVRIEVMRWLRNRSRRGRKTYKFDVDEVSLS